MADCGKCKFKGHCDTTSELYGVPKYNDGCQYFKAKKPQTNAEGIRQMSDEELAEFLCGVFDEDECNGKYICGITIPDYDEDRIAEWLKSEAKE